MSMKLSFSAAASYQYVVDLRMRDSDCFDTDVSESIQHDLFSSGYQVRCLARFHEVVKRPPGILGTELGIPHAASRETV